MNHKTDLTEKLKLELKGLFGRIGALKRVLHKNTAQFESIELLKIQLAVMTAYKEILETRIKEIEK